jgi:peptidoglycan LD-endopeptidase CwlK
MAITLGQRSLSRLDGVHPDLVRVVVRAAAMAKAVVEDFTVLEGVRTVEQMYAVYGKGRTAAQCQANGVPAKYARPKEAKVTWLSDPLMSNHRKRADGYGRAVDLAPYPIDWNAAARFDKLANLMFRAASIEGVRIRWGADWDADGRARERGESDSPHFELA